MDSNLSSPYWKYAVAYTVIFSLLFGISYYIQYLILLNFRRVILFRTLGLDYVRSVLAIGVIVHVIDLAAIWHLTLDADVQMVIWVNGTLTGLRVCLFGIFMCVFCARQLVLARIFGTFGHFPKFQSFRHTVLLACAMWIPLLIFYFLYLVNILDITVFAICYALFYLIFMLSFGFLAIKNRQITRIYSDYTLNLAVVSCLLVCLFISIWLTVQYQWITTQTYVFETAITYVCGIAYVISALIVFTPPVIQWKYHPDVVKGWDEFNKKNTFLYGRNSGGGSHHNTSVVEKEDKEEQDLSRTPSQFLATVEF